MSSEPAAPAPAPAPNAWDERLNAFASAVNKPSDKIVSALAPLVGDPGPEALAILSDAAVISDLDLQKALVDGDVKIPLGVFRKNIAKLRGPQAAIDVSTEKTHSFDALPSVPEDVSFLEMLKVGGVLKPGKTEVISAMKAAIADHLGLFDLPTTLTEKMEAFAESQEEVVGPEFYKLRKLIARRNYAEVLAVLEVPGDFVTAGRRSNFMEKLNTLLWPELTSFHRQLLGWQESWNTGLANPGMALTMLAMAQSGRGGMMLPPGMMQPPETSAVRDSGEAVINTINKVFAGFGVPVARALAFDATKIKEALENPALPAAVGATSKDQMLKMLGVTVGADYVRTERNITRYALAVMELPSVPADTEYSYLGNLIMLGAAIQWDKLPGGNAAPGRAGSGDRRVLRNGRGANAELEETSYRNRGERL